jgi:hypothetical protein
MKSTISLWMLISLLTSFTNFAHSQAIVELETDTLVLGDIETGTENYRNYFTFTNVTNEEMNIVSVKSSFGGLVPTYPADPIPAGITDTITYNIDTNNEGYKVKTITVIVKNDLSSTITDTAQIVLIWNTTSNPTNTENIDASKKVIVFPNPFWMTLNIDLSELSQDEMEVFIFDLKGQLILEKKINNNRNVIRINPNDIMRKGIYVLQIKSKNQLLMSKKIIKK